MERSTIFSNLILVLYDLLRIEDINADELFSEARTKAYIEHFRMHYSGQEICDIMEALKWALENRNYDFKSIEFLEDISFSNKEIVIFIEKIFGLFTSSFDEARLEILKVPSDNRKLNILIVEDKVYKYNTFLRFGRTPYEITDVHSYEEASPIMSQNKFDIVLSSLHSNSDDNIRLLKNLRHSEMQNGLPHVPVIVLSESNDGTYIHRLYQNGCDAHLVLPVILAELLQKICQLTQ
ncbi:MAG: response regulator [Anaerolineae bacterium]|nr:response regulator [Anaerolineae bacterium]